MIGREAKKNRSSWAQATVISLALHGAAVAGAIYQPSLPAFSPPLGPRPEPEISVEAVLPLFTPPASDDVKETEEAALPSTPKDPLFPELGAIAATAAVTAAITPEPEILRPLDLISQSTVLTTPTEAPTVALAPQVVLSPQRMGGSTDPETVPQTDFLPPGLSQPDVLQSKLPAADPLPTDPRLAALVERVRAHLDAPCLLGLPQVLDGALNLAVMAPDQRQIADFMAEIDTSQSDPVVSQPVLLDNRQCPGIAFLRRTPQYPAFGLPIQLARPEVANGTNLVGRIENGAGAYNTLLLIDDNGVVHDLRRFLIVQGGQVTFDVPITRAGTTRDTHQILIALATKDRITSVTANAGRLASDFFPALAAEVGENTLVGVHSVFIR